MDPVAQVDLFGELVEDPPKPQPKPVRNTPQTFLQPQQDYLASPRPYVGFKTGKDRLTYVLLHTDSGLL